MSKNRKKNPQKSNTKGENFNQPKLYYTSGYSQQPSSNFSNFSSPFSSNSRSNNDTTRSNNQPQMDGYFTQYDTQPHYNSNVRTGNYNRNRKYYSNIPHQYFTQPYFYRSKYRKPSGRKPNSHYQRKKNEEAQKKIREKLQKEEDELKLNIKTIEKKKKERAFEEEERLKKMKILEESLKDNKVLESVVNVIKILYKRMDDMVGILDGFQDRINKLSNIVVDLRKVQCVSLSRYEEKNYFSKSFFGEIFQKSLHQPFLTHFRMYYGLYDKSLEVSSFALSKETGANSCFKEIRSVKIPEGLRKLYTFLMDNGGHVINQFSFSKESDLFNLIGYDSEIIKYDAVIYEKSSDGENKEKNYGSKIVAVGKISVSYIVPMKDNVFKGSLDYQQMNLLKKLCQLERQVAYVRDINDLKRVYLFGIGNFTSLKMAKFFKNNEGLFPNLGKLCNEGKLFVGTFQFFASCVSNLEGFVRKIKKKK